MNSFLLISAVVYLVALASDVNADSQWKTKIMVNTSAPLHQQSCCSTALSSSRSPMICPSLNEALKCLNMTGNSTVIYLANDVHDLVDGEENVIRNMSDIGIIGLLASSGVNITCNDSAGLSFIQSDHITLANFTIQKCSVCQTSTSLNYSAPLDNDSPIVFIHYKVSIYVLLCRDLSISNVSVVTADGTGITLYDVGGEVNITNSSFLKNRDRPGGGGLQIEFSYCIPGNTNCGSKSQIGPQYSSFTRYSIINCIFDGNVGYRGYSGLRKVSNIERNTFSFGHGGGVSVIFKGSASNNSIVIKGSHVVNNVAHMGGGLYVSFHDDASDNTVSIDDTKFRGNEVKEWNHSIYDVDGGGGGMKAIFDNGQYGRSSGNTVNLRNCRFEKNIAFSGGGLWIETNLNSQTIPSNKVTIKGCSFYSNTAFLGSAIYLSNGFRKRTVNLTFESINVSSNTPKCSHAIEYSFLPCAGIIYTINIPFVINGSSSFYYNNASAIEIHEASMTVLTDSHLDFDHNESPYGSAIALFDCSSLLLSENTSLNFTNNKALESGGAIYAGSCSGGIQPADASSDCFIQYQDKTLHPNKWNTTLRFRNNTDNSGNTSIFGVSLSPCWWPAENEVFIYHKKDYENIHDTFCWNPWNYSNGSWSCDHEVKSGPALMEIHENDKQNNAIFPGEELKVPVIRDGRLKEIEHGLTACVSQGPASFERSIEKRCKEYRKERSAFLYHSDKVNETIHITIHVSNAGPSSQFGPSLKLTFISCVFPFVASPDGSVCLYKFDFFYCMNSSNGTSCEIGSNIVPYPQYCFSSNNMNITNNSSSSDDVTVGLCPRSYTGLPTYKRAEHVSGDNCANGHEGRLCGGCKADLGIPINSLNYDCEDCDKIGGAYIGVILYIILQIMPISVLIVLIIVLNIDLTTGYMIGFVFYCQIISLSFPVWIYPTWLAVHMEQYEVVRPTLTPLKYKYATSLYRIFNLDFLTLYNPRVIPICIANHMDALEVIMFSYLAPFYCLVFVLCLILWLLMYEHGVRCVVSITRPFHQCLARIWSKLKINPSLIQSLASIYILCFTPLAATSFKLLHFSTWHSLKYEGKSGKAFFYDADYQYFGFPHCLCGLLAIFVLVFVCVLPAMFLVLYPYQLFHKVIDRLKLRHQVFISFADVNTGSFCDGYKRTKDFRSFAGLYLLLRLVIMSYYYIPGHSQDVILILETLTALVLGGVIMIFRPFKQALVNFMNFMVFVLLGGMTALCLASKNQGRTVCLVSLMHLPILMVLLYIIHQCRVKWCPRCCQSSAVKSKKMVYFNDETTTTNTTRIESDGTTAIVTDDETNSDWPDRLENPGDYEKSPKKFLTSTENVAAGSNVRLLRATSINNGRSKKKSYGTY